MKLIKTYIEFKKDFVNESFSVKLDQLPKIGDIVDKVSWKEGDRFVFIDFNGVKNIPIRIDRKTD